MAKKWNAEKASFCWQKIIEQAYDQSNRQYYFFVIKNFNNKHYIILCDKMI